LHEFLCAPSLKLLFPMRFMFLGLRASLCHRGKLAMVRVMVTLETIFSTCVTAVKQVSYSYHTITHPT